MNNADPTKKWNRGRPRSDDNKQVVQALLDATELLLRDHSHHDLTERKIAAAAGVDGRMIHYYFGDKEGLLFGVIAIYCQEFLDKLKALDHIDPTSPCVTRDICQIVIDAFYARPWLARIAMSELIRSHSVIKDRFRKKYGGLGLTMERLPTVFARLVECGVYDARIKIDQAALSLYSVIVGPLVLSQLAGDDDIAFAKIEQDEWTDYVADLFDHQLRAAAPKAVVS